MRNPMYNKLKFLLGNVREEPIKYFPICSKITGGLTTGILLSQIIHLCKSRPEFWITDRDFCNMLSMGFYEFSAAKKKLKKTGLVKIKVQGIPPKTCYRINIEKIENEIIKRK